MFSNLFIRTTNNLLLLPEAVTVRPCVLLQALSILTRLSILVVLALISGRAAANAGIRLHDTISVIKITANIF